MHVQTKRTIRHHSDANKPYVRSTVQRHPATGDVSRNPSVGLERRERQGDKQAKATTKATPNPSADDNKENKVDQLHDDMLGGMAFPSDLSGLHEDDMDANRGELEPEASSATRGNHNPGTQNVPMMDVQPPVPAPTRSEAAPVMPASTHTTTGATTTQQHIKPAQQSSQRQLRTRASQPSSSASSAFIIPDKDEYSSSDDDDDSESDDESKKQKKHVTIKRKRNKSNKPAFSIALISDDPATIKEAMKLSDADEWKRAADAEMKALMRNNTWKLVERPDDRHVISCKWVLRKKYASDGSIAKYKARLVARGFQQAEGIDYDETFAPVGQYASLRVLLAISIVKDLRLYQFDVESAFLNGDLEHDIFMEQPDGYHDGSNRVCKLQKALYGLKQAAKQWNHAIHNRLIETGWRRSEKDVCLYVLGPGYAYLFLYVDDMVLAAKNKEIKEAFARSLQTSFTIKDMGMPKWLFNMSIEGCDIGVKMAQEKYINKILEKFKMSDAKPTTTPMVVNSSDRQVSDCHGQTDKDAHLPYQSLVGSLLWLANLSRPDIAYAVGKLCQRMSDYTRQDWKKAKRVVRYLINTKQDGVECDLRNKSTRQQYCLYGYADADWGSDPNDGRRSTTGYIFYLNTMPVVWSSKRQRTVALSTVEAEFYAICAATQEALYLQQLLQTMNIDVGTVIIYNDNVNAIRMATKERADTRCKHVDIKYMFVRECVANKKVEIRWIQSQYNIADILTKPLSPIKHQELAKRLRGSAAAYQNHGANAAVVVKQHQCHIVIIIINIIINRMALMDDGHRKRLQLRRRTTPCRRTKALGVVMPHQHLR